MYVSIYMLSLIVLTPQVTIYSVNSQANKRNTLHQYMSKPFTCSIYLSGLNLTQQQSKSFSKPINSCDCFLICIQPFADKMGFSDDYQKLCSRPNHTIAECSSWCSSWKGMSLFHVDIALLLVKAPMLYLCICETEIYCLQTDSLFTW